MRGGRSLVECPIESEIRKRSQITACDELQSMSRSCEWVHRHRQDTNNGTGTRTAQAQWQAATQSQQQVATISSVVTDRGQGSLHTVDTAVCIWRVYIYIMYHTLDTAVCIWRVYMIYIIPWTLQSASGEYIIYIRLYRGHCSLHLAQEIFSCSGEQFDSFVLVLRD